MENEKEEEFVNKNSHIGKLIARVNQLEKKPILDNSLNEILNTFLEKLQQSGDFLNNGIFQINFAEAALLLQSSAWIYSKKIDILWESVNECQKRMIQYNSEEDKTELKRLEDRSQKYKRRRKPVEAPNEKDKTQSNPNTFDIDWNDVHDLKNLNYERDLKMVSGWYKKMEKKLDLQPTQNRNRSFSDKHSHFRGIDDAIHDKDQDDELVVHASKMESVMGLENLILRPDGKFGNFSFSLYTQLYLIPKFLSLKQLKFEDLDKHLDELEKVINFHKDQNFLTHHNHDDDNSEFVVKSSASPILSQTQKLRRISVTSPLCSRLSLHDMDRVYSTECKESSSAVNNNELDCYIRTVTPLLIDVDETKCNSCADKSNNTLEAEDQQFDINSNVNSEMLNQISQNQDDAVLPDETSKEVITDEDVLRNDSIQKMISQNVISDSTQKCDIGDVDKEVADGDGLNVMGSTELPEACNQIEIEEMFDDDDLFDSQPIKRGPRKKEDHCEIPEKRRKLSKAALKKLATGITVDLREFSIFFSANYIPEENEGTVELPVFDRDDPVETSSRIDPTEESPLSQVSSILCTQDSGYESHIHGLDVAEEDLDEDIPLSQLSRRLCSQDSGCFDAEDIDIRVSTPLVPVDDSVPNPPTPVFDIEPGTSSQEDTEIVPNFNDVIPGGDSEERSLFHRVQEWKSHMSEKLKRTPSSDFDIHEYGFQIMENFNETNRAGMKFGNVVSGKSSAEVARFFISALQLANTRNIDIEGARKGKLSNETFSLRLITKDRYYDRLKDYQAPSEGDLRERMAAHAHKSKSKRYGSSTSGCYVAAKRCKFQ